MLVLLVISSDKINLRINNIKIVTTMYFGVNSYCPHFYISLLIEYTYTFYTNASMTYIL